MAEKPNPLPAGDPKYGFSTPGHVNYVPGYVGAVWVERVDTSQTPYTKLPRGTLYSAVTGANSKVVSEHPAIFLLREIQDPLQYPWSYRIWGLGETFTTRSIGQDNLIPPKYRRLVRHVETVQPVDVDYTFPTGLTGDQTQVELTQQTIEEAVLRILSEVIDESTDPLLGHEDSEFGSVSIYETVVDDGTPIDEGIGVIKSTVTPFGNGKSLKVTAQYDQDLTTLSAQRKSIGVENLIPAKYRGLVVHTETDTFVDPDAAFPTSLAGDQAQVKQVEETQSRARRTTVEEIIDVNADPLRGQDYDQQFDVVVPYIETLEDSGTSLGQNRKDINPLGNGKDVVRAVDPDAVAAVLEAYSLSFPGTANLQLPDVLTSLIAVVSTSTGQGTDTTSGSGSGSGHPTFWSYQHKTTMRDSSAATPDVLVEITQYWARNVPTTNYFFFLQSPVTTTDVITKLNTLAGTVTDWPQFVPQSHTIIMTGQKVDKDTTKQKSEQESANTDPTNFSYSETHGEAIGYDNSVTIRSLRIPPTIHGPITIAGDVTHSTGINGVIGTVRPVYFSATIPSSIPTTGKHLLRVDANPYKLGWVRIGAEIVDMADVT